MQSRLLVSLLSKLQATKVKLGGFTPPASQIPETAGSFSSGSAIVLTGLATAFVLGIGWLATMVRRKLRRRVSTLREQLHLETGLEERYRDLVENATDPVFTVDMHGLLRAANTAAQQTFGVYGSDLDKTCLQHL